MRVQPNQLIPGCILLKDVIAKTKSPIVYKNTVLNNIHITFLQKFLISTVEVSPKLADGTPFKPQAVAKGERTELHTQQTGNKEKDSLEVMYLQAVATYKKMFTSWQKHVDIDMPAIRIYMLPLFERVKEFDSTIFTLHRYVTKETYIFHHSVSVAILTAYVATNLGYSKGEVIQAGLAGLLSDSGMARITPKILTKTEALSTTEKKEIKHHPIHSYRLVEHIPTMSQAAKLAILQHHERQNGTGYPLGLSNKWIEKYASIIAVCDRYHAMTCERRYKEHHSPFEAIGDIQKRQYSELNPKVSGTFVKEFLKLIHGVHVQLSTNQTGTIVFVDKNDPVRPVVQLHGNEEVISLKDDPTLSITDMVHV